MGTMEAIKSSRTTLSQVSEFAAMKSLHNRQRIITLLCFGNQFHCRVLKVLNNTQMLVRGQVVTEISHELHLA